MANPFKDILRQHAAGASSAPAATPVAESASAQGAALVSLHKENDTMASECIAAGLVTAGQAEKVERRLAQLHAKGELARFDEVAMQLGFCNRMQVAELQEELRSRALLKDRYVPSPKIYNRQGREDAESALIGSRMIAAGLVTAAQRDRIMERQQKLVIQGAQIRFGELAVQLGYCAPAELDALLEDMKRRGDNPSW